MKPSALMIITEDSPESFSPAGERVRHMALAGKTLFGKVLVLTLGGARNQKQQEMAEASKSVLSYYSVNFTRAAPFPISGFFDPVKFLMLFAHGLMLQRRLKPKFILVSMPPLETGMSAWFLAKLSGRKLVVDLRDDWEAAIGSQLSRYIPIKLINLVAGLAREIYSSSVEIFAVTQPIADVARRRTRGVPVSLVPNGADTSIFKPRSLRIREETRLKHQLPSNKLVVVYCGSGINPYYRLDLVLSSLKSLPDKVRRRILLVFYVYNGFEYLKRLVGNLEMPESLVEIRSPLPRKSLAEVLGASDVGLVPFDSGEYLLCARSTKLYEYLSSGLYVVSSGPQKGELDSFFSSNPDLGSFTFPSVEGYTRAFTELTKIHSKLLSDDLRASRHLFIRENYDRNLVLTKALKTLESISPQAAT